MYVNDLDLIKAKLEAIKAISETSAISEIINSDTISQLKRNMKEGNEYYCSNNIEIHERNFE